jgi:hypothetical protein
LVGEQHRELKENTPFTFTNLSSCTQYNLKAELRWNDTQILDCEGKAIPPLYSSPFWTHPKKLYTLQLEEIEAGTDFITVNFTGTKTVWIQLYI